MALTKLVIHRKSPFAGGRPFGDVGPYELWEGTAYFAVDPRDPRNTPITDLELAPRNGEGLVEFEADFAMLRPADPERGNGRVLFDVCNRGRKTVMYMFNRAERFLDPTQALRSPGNGFLMRHGYTVVWTGWQADVPPKPGLMGLRAPEALDPQTGGPLVGRILCQFQTNEPTEVLLLSHRDHLPHPPADPQEADALLTVREHPNEPPQVIPRDRWAFVRIEGTEYDHVRLEGGFQPGLIYQLTYTTKGSRVVGLGFAAVRDTCSFLKYAPASAGNPCAGTVEYAYAFGVSQSGRFLRHLLYLAMFEDEEGRLAIDGFMPHVAGGMRGEFNLRFGQPSKDICFIMPELFPFTDVHQRDPVTGREGGLLDRARERGLLPKVIFSNTSAEYWRGDAALIHTDLAAMRDAPESENVRRYHFAGTQHGPGVFPLIEVRPLDGVRGQLPFNAVDYTPLLRACLVNLDRWVSEGVPPPASRHPSLDRGTAVDPEALRDVFQRLPGVRFPRRPTRALRLDFGPELHLGRTVKLPPEPGQPYPTLVCAVDQDGNEVDGIRLPDLTVPLATHTGWNLRHPDIGNPDLVIGISGGLAGWTLPFAPTRARREASGDPRPSIEERYPSRQDYLRRVRQEAQKLAEQGYVLAEDVEDMLEEAGRRYDALTAEAAG